MKYNNIIMARFYLYIALLFIQWSEIILEYNCVYYSKLFMKPNSGECENYMCWESQLTDRNRNELTKILNEYRISVAKGTCASCKGQRYGVIYELYYHWLPEYTCVLWLENIKCTLPPDIGTVPNLPYPEVQKRNLNAGILRSSYRIPKNRYKYRITVITAITRFPNYFMEGYYVVNNITLQSYGSINTFKLEYDEFRNDVIQKIKTLLRDEYDSKRFLKSWEGGNKYAYGRYTYYGCAILVLNNMTGETDFGGIALNERVAFLACIFVPLIFKENYKDLAATPVKSFSQEDCLFGIADLQNIVKRRISIDNAICTYEIDPTISLVKLDRPCQIYYHTYQIMQVERCSDKVPPEWAYNVYPTDNADDIIIRWLEDIDPETNEPVYAILDRLNPPTTSTKLTTTIKPELSTTISPLAKDDEDDEEWECSNFFSIECAAPLTIFIIIIILIFVVIVYLLAR